MEKLRNLQQIYSLAAGRFNQYEGKDFVLPDIFKEKVKEINSNSITYNNYSAIIETKGNQYGPLNIYLPNQWFYIASYFTDFYNELQKYKKEALKVVPKERLKELNGGNLRDHEIARIKKLDIDETSQGYLIRFMTDYSWWSGAKTIDRQDFFISPILNSARLVNASQTFVAELCAFLADKTELVQAIILGEEEPSNFDKHSQTIHNLLQISYGGPETEYIRSYLTALRTKPFMLLAGISGTGKSRIVRKLAQATTTQKYDKDEDRWKDNRPENFELIQVKPNWHNSMDVVGFYSNISGKYEFTPFVEFIVKAWQHKDTPYFLCLDEMNLAPVEEYFAEFLSAIESRSTDENDDYITDPIIKPFKNFGEKEGKSMLIQLLGDADPIDKNPIAIHFYEKGLTLPPNLMVMGTVNMDETTFSFSRKVLDRAMSVEMNEVDYDKFLSGESERFPLLTDMNELLVNRPQRAAEVTEEIESDKVIAYLKDVNTLMEGTPFKLGYRAANEAMLYVAACKKFAGSDYALANALDEFTLMKILSRIEGDDSRLGIADDDPRIATLGIEASEQHTSLLTCLKAIVHKHIGASSETEKKIDQMCNTLEREHFVSYWA